MEKEYYVLVTLELSSKDESKRKEFNQFFEKLHFVDIQKISTTWQVKIKARDLQGAHNTINNIMQTAKERFILSKIDYAYQISVNDVKIKSI